ncbi:MAG TPA: long-chain fatty acid--CoA ligase [Trebonia sp.]|nr:long-chain fatty acid--CoA ligase [Trebonia sp.]
MTSADDAHRTLSGLLDGHPFSADDPLVISESGTLSLGDVRARVAGLAATLRAAGLTAGQAVGNLVTPGPSSIVVMFAVWAAGGVYVPVNARWTAQEVTSVDAEARLSLLVGTRGDLDGHPVRAGLVGYSRETGAFAALRPARTGLPPYPHDVAVLSRTSGTTGRPKAVPLRHGGTIDAVDAAIAKLRGSRPGPAVPPAGRRRMNLIPVPLALWGAIWNTLFSLRAGFGVVLLEEFTTARFTAAVREHDVRSVVLPPAMISMLADDPEVTDVEPLRMVRSITAPLSPAVARKFHEKFGIVVLNSYGQTELGGEVAGWTAADARELGDRKLGAVGRPYQEVEVRIRRDDGSDAPPGERGEILVRSPFRMDDSTASDRLIDGFLRTGDLGYLDADGFLWVAGRVSDMINRGGLKVFPDEVEEVLRGHPDVRDACVAGRPDRRLGQVPHAWVVGDRPLDPASLLGWCRQYLAPYKVPAGFTQVDALPRNDMGKLLRRELAP